MKGNFLAVARKSNLIKTKPNTVGEAFRLPLRTLKKILTAIIKANVKIAFPLGKVSIAALAYTVACNRRD